MKFNIEDLRRVLELGDSDNDPTIIPERLAKGLWCKMGFTGHINGKMIKTMFSSAYRFMIHCVIRALSHRKGAYDEASDYIMNTIACLILNRPYNVSQVIFEYMKENVNAGNGKYIMYPRFIMMMIDDQFKDIPKINSDILGLRNMTSETIARLTKGIDERVKGMICKIDRPAYVAPEDDKRRHEKSDSDNEDQRMSELLEKKPDGGTSVQPQQRLVDETVINPSSIPQDAIYLTKVTLEQFIKLNEAAGAAQKDQGSSAQAEGVKATKPEGVVQDDSSEDDSEATESKSELDPTTLGRGKAQQKKKPTKKQKASDEEDSTYIPDEPKKQRANRKAVQAGVIPRRVRAKKTGAELPKDKDGKKEKHVEKSKIQESEKAKCVEIPKEPEVQNVEVPVVVVQKKTSGDDYVEITGFKAATTPPPPPPHDQPKSSHPKDTSFDYFFEGLPSATGIYKEDIPEDDYDMFNNEAKAKAEVERDALKRQIEELMKAHDQIRMVLIDQEEKINKMEDDAEGYTKLFNVMQEEISKMNKELAKMNDINHTLNQLLSEISEASSNEMKAMKLEMEAMKADKVMKDNQLNMLYSVMESHLKIDVHDAFNEIEVKRAEDRRIERERRLAEEAKQKNKSVIEDIQEAGGSSSQVDVEMVDAEADPLGFVLRKAREVLMLEWKKEEVEEETPNFILVGKASLVPYNIKEIVRQIKVKERRRKAKIARGEIVDDDSDKELFDDEEEDEDDNDDDDTSDKKDNEDDKCNDDQGASGLLVENPNVQQRIEELLNDEINEQEDDLHHEASTSGKQHVDPVFLTNPTVIYLNAQYEGEIEVQRSRAEMLEELGLEDGKFKFDIEDEIPRSPEKVFEFRYAHEADHYNDVIVEDASDSSDEETDFHYSRVDETFPSLSEMFKDRNVDEIRRTIVEKVSTEGVPTTIPRENLAEEHKKWFKVMPKERKSL
ncbi:hypothetical protein HanPI659440_Chr17g0696081 [Helianthus annuus]|nr:hypothetical protein HanPI659440_Chr17g0696081 [Helianthus annuus]